MTAAEIWDVLIVWTPYLAAGFGWNIIVSLAAMAIGTPVGLVLAMLREGRRPSMQQSGGMLTTLARNVPTFVMLFYLAYVIPTEFELFGQEIVFPAWLKASLALGIAVAGYVSDNALAAIRHLRRHEVAEALLFLPAWTGYFLIIAMASSTASVIGVPELVHRSETVIGAIGNVDVVLWVYLYAMLWFFVFGAIVSLAMRLMSSRLRGHGHGPAVVEPAAPGGAGQPLGSQQ